MWGFGPSRQVPLYSPVFLLIPQAQPELRSAGSASIPRSSARLTATQSPHVNQPSGMHRGSGSVQSLPSGEVGFVSSALVFRLISSWLRSALLSCSRQRLAALQLASFLATPGWAGPGWEHLLGTALGGVRQCFCQIKKLTASQPPFLQNLNPPLPSLYLSNAFLETSMLRELANHCPVTGRKWSPLFIYNANSEESSEVW